VLAASDATSPDTAMTALGDNMTPLQREALGSLALPEKQIEDIFSCSAMMTREKAIEQLKRLCVSHERLRELLRGAEILLMEDSKK